MSGAIIYRFVPVLIMHSTAKTRKIYATCAINK